MEVKYKEQEKVLQSLQKKPSGESMSEKDKLAMLQLEQQVKTNDKKMAEKDKALASMKQNVETLTAKVKDLESTIGNFQLLSKAAEKGNGISQVLLISVQKSRKKINCSLQCKDQ